MQIFSPLCNFNSSIFTVFLAVNVYLQSQGTNRGKVLTWMKIKAKMPTLAEKKSSVPSRSSLIGRVFSIFPNPSDMDIHMLTAASMFFIQAKKNFLIWKKPNVSKIRKSECIKTNDTQCMTLGREKTENYIRSKRYLCHLCYSLSLVHHQFIVIRKEKIVAILIYFLFKQVATSSVQKISEGHW